MKIISITTKTGVVYQRGAAQQAGETPVESITYNRDGNLYNKGFFNSTPSYTIRFVESKTRDIVPESEVIHISVDTTKEEKKKVEDEADAEANIGVGQEG